MHKIWVKQASREFDPPYQRAPTNNTQTKAKMMLSSIRTSRLSSIRRNHTVPFNGACASCSTHLTTAYDAALQQYRCPRRPSSTLLFTASNQRPTSNLLSVVASSRCITTTPLNLMTLVHRALHTLRQPTMTLQHHRCPR